MMCQHVAKQTLLLSAENMEDLQITGTNAITIS